MGRVKREISENGIYQIYLCGINKQNIFSDASDFEFFLSCIERNRKDFLIFAYCLMKDSVNLLIKEQNTGSLPKAMQRILTNYASYYNRKNNRSGSLFENRYKSVPVADREVFEAMNFIHKIPKNYTEYKWSGFSDIAFCDGDFSEDFEKIYSKKPQPGFDLSNMQAVKDRRLLSDLKELLGDIKIEELPKKERDEVLKMLRENGFTIGQLMRLTGISRSIITRSTKEKPQKENKKEMQVFLL